ncbi:MAG: hypothetical protein PHT94_02605 [Candidatus Nanoarchaeia archaeon]|nr:hypothetical protein [Candidatus Nanoarchaeia archaeon]
MKIKSKKAVDGVGTMIIFIAMVLVASVAASVLVMTSSALQDRAYAVGNEARERLVTGIDVISILGNADVLNEEIESLEVLIRLSAGSPDVQLKSAGMTFTSKDFSLGATLQTQTNDIDLNGDPFDTIHGETVTTNYTISRDLDGDIYEDQIRIVSYNSSVDALEFKLSKNDRIAFAILNDKIEVGNVINVSDVMIKEEDYGTGNLAWGFVTAELTITEANVIKPTDGALKITLNPIEYVCSLDNINHLIPETRYCSVTSLGNSNFIVESGEILRLLYKFSDAKVLKPNQKVEFQFVPKRGSIVSFSLTIPDVISAQKITLWP